MENRKPYTAMEVAKALRIIQLQHIKRMQSDLVPLMRGVILKRKDLILMGSAYVYRQYRANQKE